MRTQKHLRTLTRIAAPYGVIFEGYTGGGHLRFKHPNGCMITASATPSDWRSQKNFERDCRRVQQGIYR